MKKIILDTSALIKWFTKEKGFQKLDELFNKLKENKIQVYLPELAKYEFGNALLKGKKLSFIKAKLTLNSWYKLPLIFLPENNHLALTSYQIAIKLNITYYDAAFLALAKAEKATLVTANPKHQKKMRGIIVKKV